MFAKIMIGNEVYISPVMALTLSGWNSKAVVLNADSSKLIVIDLYRSNSSNQFLLIDYNHDNFEIVENNFKSYWDKRNIFKIVKSKKYTLEMLNEAKNILDNFNDSKYIDVKSNKDLEMLELNTGSFHDSYILAMKQKGNGLEIVFDTTWGSLVVLKCSEIIENTLNVGDTFFHCDMRIDEKEQYIEFNFDSPKYNEERVLKVNKISLNFLFEKQTVLKNFDYSIDDGRIDLKLNNIDYSFSYRDIHNDLLDLKERNVIGYIDIDNDMVKCFILLENHVLCFYSYDISNKEKAKRTLLVNKVNEFINDCRLHNLYFDDFPYYDYFCAPIEERLGELIFSQKYSRIYGLLNMIKYIMIVPLGWNILCLIIQLLNPEMKWAFYLIFGIGIPAFTLLIEFVVILKELLSKNSPFDSCFEIREKGIVYVNGYRAIETNFEGISNLTYEDKISFYVDDKKYTLHKSKNDKKIYELIKEKYDGILR